uniref:Integrase catalytic domain-containing protein n=1 Tax=Salarias fasciatus TaxID=181472 RepID=A0A672GIA8_SALFA
HTGNENTGCVPIRIAVGKFYTLYTFFFFQGDDTFISKEEIEDLLKLGITYTEVASVLRISRPTLYKLMRAYGIRHTKFSEISDQELDETIKDIKAEHPHVGEVMLKGHLRARNIVVQRHRLRASVRRVDDAGVHSRRTVTVRRRVYTVPCPKYIWHIDGNHKLIRWKLAVHAAMDGYSRMLTFLQCSNNNRAETVQDLFNAAISEFGRPLHIRTDQGGENVRIWEDMRLHRGENSALTGSSVHNQRTERFNRDLNKNCRDVFAPIFYELESMETLDVDNESDLFCLHFVYIPRVNRTLEEFKAAFNHHTISSEGNRTPAQLFTLDRHLLTLNFPQTATNERTVDTVATSHTQHSFCPLNQQDLQELVVAVNPLENDGNKGKTIYLVKSIVICQILVINKELKLI